MPFTSLLIFLLAGCLLAIMSSFVYARALIFSTIAYITAADDPSSADVLLAALGNSTLGKPASENRYLQKQLDDLTAQQQNLMVQLSLF